MFNSQTDVIKRKICKPRRKLSKFNSKGCQDIRVAFEQMKGKVQNLHIQVQAQASEGLRREEVGGGDNEEVGGLDLDLNGQYHEMENTHGMGPQ